MSERPPNDEMERTKLGSSGASPLISVLGRRGHVTVRKTLRVAGATFAVVVVGSGPTLALWLWLRPSTVQVRRSPDGHHKAVLKRVQRIDLNFIVTLDGTQVFWSPDFAPTRLDCRERLAWDRTGKRVVLEVAGERLFGYDAELGRQLSHEELASVAFPSLSELHFEGELPTESKAALLPNSEMQRTKPAQAMELRR